MPLVELKLATSYMFHLETGGVRSELPDRKKPFSTPVHSRHRCFRISPSLISHLPNRGSFPLIVLPNVFVGMLKQGPSDWKATVF